MASEEKLEAAARQLFAQLALPGDEVADLFQKAIDENYWRGLVPTLGVLNTQGLACQEEEPLSLEEEVSASRHLAKHGYFQFRPVASRALIARMRVCVETLRSAGWPLVFTYVYDEFWAILRSPSMVRFLTRELGSNYLQTAPVWTYRVDPKARGSGWPPHTDGRRGVDRLTVWIPLVDVSTGNGCMYVIPQSSVPGSLATDFSNWISVSRADLTQLLHNVTPLPAAAGSVMGWNHGAVHWGGRGTDPAAAPRISIGLEFIPAGAPPDKHEIPTVGADLPSMQTRLRLIGKAIHAYEKFEPSQRRYRELGTMLKKWSR